METSRQGEHSKKVEAPEAAPLQYKELVINLGFLNTKLK
jgi:hypothetical protein